MVELVLFVQVLYEKSRSVLVAILWCAVIFAVLNILLYWRVD